MPEPSTYNLSPAFLEFIRQREGFSASPYADGAQTSIGYGTRATPGQGNITQGQALVALNRELGSSAAAIDRRLGGLNLTPAQREALVSFGFNAGDGRAATALARIRQGGWSAGEDYMGTILSSNPSLRRGLENRRAAERAWAASDSGSAASDPAAGNNTSSARLPLLQLGSPGRQQGNNNLSYINSMANASAPRMQPTAAPPALSGQAGIPGGRSVSDPTYGRVYEVPNLAAGERPTLANGAPLRPEDPFLRLASDVIGRTPYGQILNGAQALVRRRFMTDTPVGRLAQSVGHLFDGTLGEHNPNNPSATGQRQPLPAQPGATTQSQFGFNSPLWGAATPNNSAIGRPIPTNGRDWIYGGSDAQPGAIVGSQNGQPIIQGDRGPLYPGDYRPPPPQPLAAGPAAQHLGISEEQFQAGRASGRYGSAGQNYGSTSQEQNAQFMADQARRQPVNDTGNTGDEGHTIFPMSSPVRGRILPGDDFITTELRTRAPVGERTGTPGGEGASFRNGIPQNAAAEWYANRSGPSSISQNLGWQQAGRPEGWWNAGSYPVDLSFARGSSSGGGGDGQTPFAAAPPPITASGPPVASLPPIPPFLFGFR